MAGSSTTATPPNVDWETWSIGHKIFHEQRWQQILDSQDEDFKRANLRFLRLEVSSTDTSDLFHLATKVTGDLRKYVQYIWLNIAFHECKGERQPDEAEPDDKAEPDDEAESDDEAEPDDETESDDETDRRHKKVLREAILQLFRALEDWKAPGPNGKGIAIELSAQSFSYKAHFNFDKSYFGSRDEVGAQLDPEVGHQELDKSAFPDYTKRIHKNMTFRFPLKDFPTLPAVTNKDSSSCIIPFITDFYRLEDGLLLSKLPETITDVSVYEDNNESYAQRIAGVDRLLRVPNASLGIQLAEASQNLTKLSVAFMVEAEDFFDECCGKEAFRWPHLDSLALTSRLLARDDDKAILEMLKKAARVAERMVNLKTMAIWFGTEHTACCFAYHLRSGHSRITWQGTKSLVDDTKLIRLWTIVAWKQDASFDGFVQEGLSDIGWKLNSTYFAGLAGQLNSARELKSHGHAAFLFGDTLPADVIDPLSLWQMQQEARVL
ncbi:hypothetical protein GCG54_00007737 [Colletotrichum gloeosporioides]|uniref:DUF6546 domain-containing protein n=1 Tax=Colletotrichum gloeosporioides TaxID=474922 RepID=A0A8H4CAE3_COLGL|nr:uncharacterized protein GCG54_00007737 [Colletotrichum gloeosporioides]KAF3800290.1 hypothetical protein GCG54_00007737 [Colletotrichum gloeosporioides]